MTSGIDMEAWNSWGLHIDDIEGPKLSVRVALLTHYIAKL